MEIALLRVAFGYLREQCANELEFLQGKMPESGQIPVVKNMDAKSMIEKRFHKTYADDGTLSRKKKNCFVKL